MDIFQPSAMDAGGDSGIISLIESLSMLRTLVVPEATVLSERELCTHAAHTCIGHRDLECCALYLQRDPALECLAHVRRDLEHPGSPSAGLAALAARACATRMIQGGSDETHASLLAAPLTGSTRVHGVLVVGHPTSGRYSCWHERLLQLVCDVLVQMLEHGRLVRGQRDTIAARTRALNHCDASLDAERRRRSAAESALARESQLRDHLARRDPLTGLLNRAAFESELARLLAQPAATGGGRALLHIDIDRFRVINDAAGQAAGDQLIRLLAGLLREHFAAATLLGRLGNDEFAILVEGAGAERVEHLAESLCDAVDDFQFSFRGYRFVISLSVGVAEYHDGDSGEQLLRKAYSACLSTQEVGGGNIHLYREHDGKLKRRSHEAQALSQLVRALEEDRLELFSQPIVANARAPQAAAEPINYEILLRLKGEDGDLIPPGQFLPIAERYGLSVKLDRWVVRSVLQTLAEHAERFDRFGYVTINLSGHSLGSRGFLDYVIEQLRHFATAPGKICFEVTETVAISDLQAARRFIAGLKSLGCCFALDDFGSGYASYLYLRDLEVDFLKIDGEFVQGIATDSANLALIRSINDIGKILGKRTIAEHVENDATLALLEEIGIDLMQGYFIGRPEPLRNILEPSRSH
ncbi:putative bifunctional diguanylate cyclase/phosphodiesterase [Marichromatium bheemlicum]|uniref:EAL domain-containing protein n=1 Tax=Marichromatium bheemlicum TaxID=365339 RepID=A0ABX1I3T0_9GAMM|nr:EAL domain-containing protein [Marichromatium bheemlicum]NKN31733.1 EAL domain-containing protein [Marichromatium bheemlicum]